MRVGVPVHHVARSRARAPDERFVGQLAALGFCTIASVITIGAARQREGIGRQAGAELQREARLVRA
jgi:hypothetical protein